jgi:hypothetical protein
MTNNIRSIFEQNIALIASLDKAIYYFRRQEHDKALGIVADSMDMIKYSIEAIIMDKEYFNLIKTDSVMEMLGGVLDALKSENYILLADLLEMQMGTFLCGIQELIISKEEIGFDDERYHKNLNALKDNGIGLSKVFEAPIDPEHFLKEGYRVEFTSSGLMTLVAENNDRQFYFHTNGKVLEEAFFLATHWYKDSINRYSIYGLGFGYHIQELLLLDEYSNITIYESDHNVIKLACAFTNIRELFDTDRLRLVYDPDYQFISDKLGKIGEGEAFYVHYPSYQNIRSIEAKRMLENYVSWSKSL